MISNQSPLASRIVNLSVTELRLLADLYQDAVPIDITRAMERAEHASVEWYKPGSWPKCGERLDSQAAFERRQLQLQRDLKRGIQHRESYRDRCRSEVIRRSTKAVAKAA